MVYLWSDLILYMFSALPKKGGVSLSFLARSSSRNLIFSGCQKGGRVKNLGKEKSTKISDFVRGAVAKWAFKKTGKSAKKYPL